MIGIQDASGKSGISAVKARDAGGNFNVAKVSVLMPDLSDYVVFDSAAAGGLTVEIDPPFANAAGGSTSSIVVDSNEVTANVTSAGTPPYTYAWVQDSGDSDWDALSPSAQSTRFRKANLAANTSSSAVFEVTVTDDRGRTGTAQITAQAINYGSPF